MQYFYFYLQIENIESSKEKFCVFITAFFKSKELVISPTYCKQKEFLSIYNDYTHIKFHLIVALDKVNYIWLPRFSLPEIISDNELFRVHNLGSNLMLNEAGGVLIDEMEASLVWVLNTISILKKVKVV